MPSSTTPLLTRRLPWLLLLIVIAIAYYASYVRYGINFHDDGATFALGAKRLLAGERPFLEVELGYNVLWYYPAVGLFKLFGVNFVLLRGYCFALSVLTAVLTFLTLERVSRRAWLAFVIALLPVFVPGMTFKNYMPLLAVANICCLVHFALGARPQRVAVANDDGSTEEYMDVPCSPSWGWLVGGAIVLGLTFLIRIDVGTFFLLLWIGGQWLLALRPLASAGARAAMLIGAPLVTIALATAVHVPVYLDAVKRGFHEPFVDRYKEWPRKLIVSLDERLRPAPAAPVLNLTLTPTLNPAPATPPPDPVAKPEAPAVPAPPATPTPPDPSLPKTPPDAPAPAPAPAPANETPKPAPAPASEAPAPATPPAAPDPAKPAPATPAAPKPADPGSPTPPPCADPVATTETPAAPATPAPPAAPTAPASPVPAATEPPASPAPAAPAPAPVTPAPAAPVLPATAAPESPAPATPVPPPSPVPAVPVVPVPGLPPETPAVTPAPPVSVAPVVEPAKPAAPAIVRVEKEANWNTHGLRPKTLADLGTAKDDQERALILLRYLPVFILLPLALWAFIAMLLGWRSNELGAMNRPVAALLVIGGALTIFPQYFFWRSDAPHISEFMPGYWAGAFAAVFLLGWSDLRRTSWVARTVACLFLLALTAHAGLYLWRMLPDRWTGTIAARGTFQRKGDGPWKWKARNNTLFHGANGVDVYVSKKEAADLEELKKLVPLHSNSTNDYLIAYPYHPQLNLLLDRRTYEKNVYVDNATAGRGWNEAAIARIQKHQPHFIVLSDWAINGNEESRFSVWAEKTKTWIQTNYLLQTKLLEFEIYTRPEKDQ